MLMERAATEPNPDHRVDRIGALASAVCAVHCVVSAFLPQAFAALGLGVLLGHEAEWGFTLVAFVFAATALYLGFTRHRSSRVALTLGLGIVALLLAKLLEESVAEPVGMTLSVLAGATLVFGHFSNIRARRAQLKSA
jgi:hypothetical protein